MRVYHRTTPEAADAIRATGRFLSRENTGDVFVSNRRGNGYTEGYGAGIVALDVPDELLTLDDEFPTGERHYAVPARVILPAWILP